VCRPFSLLSDDELSYVLLLFIANVAKKDRSLFPPATLRSVILLLQKFLEVNHGCIVKFLYDVKVKPIYDALDAVMRRSANLGIGLYSSSQCSLVGDGKYSLGERIARRQQWSNAASCDGVCDGSAVRSA